MESSTTTPIMMISANSEIMFSDWPKTYITATADSMAMLIAITSGPLAGLTARAVVVLDENDKVIHSELVSEIKNEPDYVAALAAL